MSKIKKSLAGRLFGLNHNDELQGKGLVFGDHGNQVRMGSPAAVSFFDDFLGDVVADQWNYVEGTDSVTSAGAILSGGIGGVFRITTGDAGTGLAADLAQLTQELQWQASNGGLSIQARIKLSRITTAYAFFGFTDVGTLEAPIISAASGNTLTSNASNAVGFMFDTNMTADTWWLVGVAGDTDATAQNTGIAPVADDYATFRIEVTAAGVATFFINGAQVGTSMSGAVTAGADLTPTVAIGNLSGTASFNGDIDYVHVTMNRAADGDAT